MAYSEPRDFKHFEIYVSSTPSFNPTGWDGSAWTAEPNEAKDWNGNTNTLFLITTTKPIPVSGLKPGTTYYLKVVAVDKSNQRSSPSSEYMVIAGDAQRSDTIVVAASNASAAAQAGADYVCTGTADQNVINTAINALPESDKTTGTAQSGTINTIVLAASASVLTSEYNGFSITITAGTGSGQTKVISSYNGPTKTATLTSNWSVTPDNTSQYRISCKSGTVKLTEGTFYLTGDVLLKSFVNFKGAGMATELRRVSNSNGGANVGSWNETGNRATSISVSDMLVDAGGLYGYCIGFTNVPNTKVQNVRCINAQNPGISLTYCDNSSVFNCCSENTSTGLAIIDSPNVTVSGGQFNNNTSTGIHVSSNNCIVVNNQCNKNGVYGIVVDEDYSNVSNNTCVENGYYGIFVESGDHNAISENNCTGNGTNAHNTYANIMIWGSAYTAANIIKGNICRAGLGTNKPKYGIRINSANCDVTCVTNNDCYTGGVTNGISNAGSNTNFGAGNRVNGGTWSTTPS